MLGSDVLLKGCYAIIQNELMNDRATE